MKKLVKCSFEPCPNKYEASIRGGIWHPSYCPQCNSKRVWFAGRGRDARIKEIEAMIE